MYLIILPAILMPVAFSIPSRPGDEFTSSIIGPRDDCNISTPAIARPSDFAAFKAAVFSVRLNLIIEAVDYAQCT